jgi:hypothetical protein
MLVRCVFFLFRLLHLAQFVHCLPEFLDFAAKSAQFLARRAVGSLSVRRAVRVRAMTGGRAL